MDIIYFAWETITADEKNAWWLMMVVFTATCITFIYTNAKIRHYLRNMNKLLKEIKNGSSK